jgi:hypothetical protein
MHIELWGQIFKEFQQVTQVSIDSSTEQLDIIIDGEKEILHVNSKELDASLNEFNGNPHEVVTSFLKKHGVLVYYQNTLVGFFDIQAYSSFIEHTEMMKAVKSITHCLQLIKDLATTDAFAVKLDHWILSDSIIVVVDTNRHPLFFGSVLWFMQSCSMIMRESMKYGFPLRGAIGGGDFYNDGEIMVSSALVDAAKYEKEQDWLGAVLTRKALQLIEKAKKFEIMHKGKTNIDFASKDHNFCVKYGIIPWKPRSEYAKREDMLKMYYIKPHMEDIDDIIKKNWASRFLPSYFNDQLKIKNSQCLYAE